MKAFISFVILGSAALTMGAAIPGGKEPCTTSTKAQKPTTWTSASLAVPTTKISISIPTTIIPTSIPTISLPTISVPTISIPTTLPTISIPTVSIPTISIPTTTIPTPSPSPSNGSSGSSGQCSGNQQPACCNNNSLLGLDCTLSALVGTCNGIQACCNVNQSGLINVGAICIQI